VQLISAKLGRHVAVLAYHDSREVVEIGAAKY